MYLYNLLKFSTYVHILYTKKSNVKTHYRVKRTVFRTRIHLFWFGKVVFDLLFVYVCILYFYTLYAYEKIEIYK